MQDLIELGLHTEAGVPVVNSRDLARVFDKQHQHVLRDIESVKEKISPELDRSWFRTVVSMDSYGREQPSVDLTRDGFTLLVMGWTGERAMAFKVAYIEAFNAMERTLSEGKPVTSTELLQAIREIVAPLAIRFEGQDRAIDRIETRVDAIAEDVGSIKLKLFNTRRRITEPTKRDHVDANVLLGGRCPCCGENDVVVGNIKSPFAEFDHFYQASFPDAEHTWLICKKCHTGLTTGRKPRDRAESHFRAYQEKRRQLPGRQRRLNLFD
jgi:Rha family phage regulatory protein